MKYKARPSFGGTGPLVVTVTDIAMPGDEGVAKADDFVVFVPGTIPGDRVAIRIVRREKRYGYGEVVALQEPSPYRIEAPCPHFGVCGGCTIQSMDYAKQLEIKGSHLRQSLKRIGGIDVAGGRFSEITSSPLTYFYRSKIELTFGSDGNRIIAGMRESASAGGRVRPGVVPVPDCMIFSPALGEILAVVEEHTHSEGLFPYDERTKRGTLRHLILRQSKSTGNIMVIIETRGDEGHAMGELYDRLKKAVPRVTSLWRAISNRPGSYIDYSHLRHEGGERFIQETLAGLTLNVYPASFLQPNPAGAALLYEEIGRIAGSRQYGNVLGLYCGMAPIELLLSRNAQKVTGIDSLKGNIENARENASINSITNCSFLTGKVEDIVMDRGFKKPDLIVIDPPRSGLGARGMSLMTALMPATLIYVSCNPATLARDLGRLIAAGYSLERVAPFDLFPHTSHLETLTVLKRKGK